MEPIIKTPESTELDRAPQRVLVIEGSIGLGLALSQALRESGFAVVHHRDEPDLRSPTLPVPPPLPIHDLRRARSMQPTTPWPPRRERWRK